jgi:hypothetical protein
MSQLERQCKIEHVLSRVIYRRAREHRVHKNLCRMKSRQARVAQRCRNVLSLKTNPNLLFTLLSEPVNYHYPSYDTSMAVSTLIAGVLHAITYFVSPSIALTQMLVTPPYQNLLTLGALITTIISLIPTNDKFLQLFQFILWTGIWASLGIQYH